MKKIVALLALMAIPAVALAESKFPNQEIGNTKSYTGINYNRQDSEQVGEQKIINDHSWFNINIQIIKKGALFKSENKEVGTSENK